MQDEAPIDHGLTQDNYHQKHEFISNSMLGDFHESAAYYHAVYVAKTLRAKETDAMRFGRAFHVAAQQPDLWLAKVAVRPDFDCRKKADKLAKDEWEAAVGDKTIIDEADALLIPRMVHAMQKHDEAPRFMGAKGDVERPLVWQDLGLNWKCMPDRYIASGTVLDFKSIDGRPGIEWVWQAKKFGYHRQAAHYVDGLKANGRLVEAFIFIVCGREEPHECALYRIDHGLIELGRRQNRETMARLAECYRSGRWRSPYSVGVGTLGLSSWNRE